MDGLILWAGWLAAGALAALLAHKSCGGVDRTEATTFVIGGPVTLAALVIGLLFAVAIGAGRLLGDRITEGRDRW